MSARIPHSRRRAAVAASAAALVTAAAALLAPPATARADDALRTVTPTLPEPSGPHRLGTFEMHLVDADRTDPWAPDGGPREVMVNIWYPAAPHARGPRTPYMSHDLASYHEQSVESLGAPADSVDFTGIRTHARTGVPAAPGATDLPVLVYSPGGGLSRTMGTTLVEDLASRGHIVVTVDHTYQAPVELPDGMEFPASGVDMSQALRERVRDITFVLDELADLRSGANPDTLDRPIPDGVAAALDLTRVGMFGHSMGGFASAETMLTDPRIDAGVNMDGSMPPRYGQAAETGVDRPFLLMGAGTSGDDGRPHHHLDTPEWRTFWDRSTGWRRDVYMADGEHMSFTDHQVLLPQLADALELEEEERLLTEAIGTVPHEQSLAAQRAYLSAFFDLHLRGGSGSLFEEPSPEHPAVELIE
ncbi:alpha/beta hydrolase family protein [Marinactinospora rubrisoli]|uniref:Alpha/beta hydrolase family protein n=1 Tax=Marinactinospora rubrisoli TaxID=2715399 RepID=A0ABW2KFI8_9ACTN